MKRNSLTLVLFAAIGCLLMQPAGAQLVDVDVTDPLNLFDHANDQTAAQIQPVGHFFHSGQDAACCDTPCDGGCDSLAGQPSCDAMGTCCCRPGKPKCECCKCRETFFGDVGGYRSCFAEHGVIYKASLTQFYQGVTSGGTDEVFRYGGKVDQYFIFEGEKLGLWKGGRLIMHADSQYGQNSIADAALLAPVNSAMLTPLPTRAVTAITNFQFEQELAGGWAATFGKFNFLDLWGVLYPEYGKGLDGFMNTSQIAPLNVVPTLPVVFNAAGLLKSNERGVTLGLMAVDTRETQTVAGLDGLFENGVTILGLGRVFTDFGGLPGSHLIAGTYATGTFTNFEPRGWLVLPPGIPVVPLVDDQTGSWLAAYVGEQRLWEDRCNKQRHVGLWGMAGWSDPDTSPYEWTMNISIEAHGLSSRRQQDRMGIGYFYEGLSEPFKATGGAVTGIALQDLQGGEFYYNAEVHPWFHVTGDLQIVQTEDAAQDTAVVLGVRAKIDL